MRIRRCALELLIAATLIAACVSQAQFDEPQNDDEAARINVQLGAAYLAQGNLGLANTKLERALKENPDLATAHWLYALLQTRLGRPKLADKHFQEAIKLDPGDSRGHNAYGTFLCRADRLAEAQIQFRQALDNPLYSTPETTLTNAGVCASKADNVDKAEAFFLRALNKDPQFAPALYEMARLNFNQQRYVRTQAYLRRYKQNAGYDAATLWLAVQTETKLGNRDAAASYALELKRRYPDSRETAQLVEWSTMVPKRVR
jgi:type IV pilus assembly protein PilF